MTLPNHSAASEGLRDLACGASDPALGRRLEAHRDYLTILARTGLGPVRDVPGGQGLAGQLAFTKDVGSFRA